MNLRLKDVLKCIPVDQEIRVIDESNKKTKGKRYIPYGDLFEYENYYIISLFTEECELFIYVTESI